MSARPQSTTRQMPIHLVEAMESGELTSEQLREIICFEAEQFGLSFDEAVRLAKLNQLPKNPAGSSLQFHILMLVWS